MIKCNKTNIPRWVGSQKRIVLREKERGREKSVLGKVPPNPTSWGITLFGAEEEYNQSFRGEKRRRRELFAAAWWRWGHV